MGVQLELELNEVDAECNGIRGRLDPLLGGEDELEAVEREQDNLTGQVQDLDITKEDLNEAVQEGKYPAG